MFLIIFVLRTKKDRLIKEETVFLPRPISQGQEFSTVPSATVTSILLSNMLSWLIDGVTVHISMTLCS